VVSPEPLRSLVTVAPPRPGSVLVTGVPRSGTTWLARELARSRGAGLAGREPMNPRRGQFALGGTVTGWTELAPPSARQARLLRRCYAGREPRVLSRYGEHQLRAALPGGTTVVKDPFALLSLPAVVAATGTAAVVVYRPAAAVLASYRRMGWRADTTELRALPGAPSGPAPQDDAEAMVEFWNELHERVLQVLPGLPGVLVVSHAELLAGGAPAVEVLLSRLGLPSLRPVAARQPARTAASALLRRRVRAGRPRLHDFQRSGSEVAEGWRSRVDDAERLQLERATASVWQRLEDVRTPVEP